MEQEYLEHYKNKQSSGKGNVVLE